MNSRTVLSMVSMMTLSVATACGSSSPGATAPVVELPSAPQSVFASAASKSVTLQWTAPQTSGGQKIVSYTVVPDPNAAPATGATSATITGLTDGTPYVFAVTATTASGTGPAALSNIVVPGSGATSSAPVGVVAVARDAEARVSWAAPSSAGGSTVTGYWVTVTPGGVGQPCKGTSLLVLGLTNGTTYEFSVEALNSGGASVNATSNPVTPEAGAGLFDGGAPDAGAADATGTHEGGPPDATPGEAEAPDADGGQPDDASDGKHHDARPHDAHEAKDAKPSKDAQ